MMSDNRYISQWKEDYSKAFVSAVAAQSGWKVGTWSQDKDLMDVVLETSVEIETPANSFLSLKIDLQLKCTESPSANNSNFISFEIEKSHIERIKRRIGSDPFFFVLIHVPKNQCQWIEQSHIEEDLSGTIMRYCCYFKEIFPFERSPSTFRFSKSNVFSLAFLNDLKEKRNTLDKIENHYKKMIDRAKNPLSDLDHSNTEDKKQ